jgi:carbon-monoxide dehydrogenase medium subunit
MKPAAFRHHAPSTVAEAVEVLAHHGDEAKALAGGQSLVPLLAMRMSRFEHLVDLNGVAGLQGISRHGGTLRVGAMTRQRAAERSAEVRDATPLLAAALPLIGHFQIRNRGTVGGSIAHADPASELPAVIAALDAELEIASVSSTRRVAAADFFLGHFTTAVADGELLVAIHLPVASAGSGSAVREFARRHGDFAIAGVAVALDAPDGAVERAAISFFGMGATPLRSPSAESALIGTRTAAVDSTEIAAMAVAETDPSDDIHASADNRRHIAVRLAADAIDSALSRAIGAAA